MLRTRSWSQFGHLLAILTNNSYCYILNIEIPQLDHFAFADKRTFKIKYLINDKYWTPSTEAPIFFYPGNEGPIEELAEATVTSKLKLIFLKVIY